MIKPDFKSAISAIAVAAALGSSLFAAPAARANACHDVHISVAPSKPDGRSWDVGSVGGVRVGHNVGNPDIQPTIDGKTYPRIMDSFQWSRRIQLNSDQVYISITDWDFFKPDGIGAGPCPVPTTNCRLGQATIKITTCQE
ncbi:MAG: hypothetical protein L3J67_00910 [Hyphomicrobiaceae bacterium]|nr:hypothetical protein [Hyphomicrobiaceae bacterium]